MITILSSFKTLLLFLVVVTTGTTTPALFHQDIGAQIFGQGGSDGISSNKDGQFSTDNPVLFDPFGEIDFAIPLASMESITPPADENSMTTPSESAPTEDLTSSESAPTEDLAQGDESEGSSGDESEGSSGDESGSTDNGGNIAPQSKWY